jgi:hypothetical protein
MSFPRLVLTGDQVLRTITDIAVSYDNNGSIAKPASLTRVKYDVKRITGTDNVSVGTPQRRQDMPYDKVRWAHTWIGYLDVLTESVSYVPGQSTIADGETQALIKSAGILEMATGPEHTIASFYGGESDLGPDKPSIGGMYETATNLGLGWVYNISKDGEAYVENETVYWFIRDINIQDNQNNTSRVTFHFEYITKWISIADIIEHKLT